MIELEKIYASIAKNNCNLDIIWIIEIPLVSYCIYMVSWNWDKVVFYINNNIDWDQFNQLYDFDWIEKDIWNVYAVARKLWLILIKVIHYELEVAKNE